MPKVIAIVGTLDTKGTEFQFLKDQIEGYGLRTLVINAGPRGEPPFLPDISARQVIEAAGEDLATLMKEADRGHTIAAICRGVSVIVADLYRQGKFNGIISMGGGAGTTIGSAAMRVLPIGVPKLLVSTVASGNVQPYVDVKDITMMPAITDIAGLNRISRKIIANAAGAIAGMVKLTAPIETGNKPVIGASMFGVTTPCINHARELLEEKGYEVLVFHASGTGGRTLEDLISNGLIQGVLDLTTHEIADELVGGVRTAGANRLEAAGARGIPQVVSAGALDMVNFGPPETVPDKFQSRLFYPHTPKTTLMRSTIEENTALGRIIAEKLNRARGPTTFIVPLKGFSLMDKAGQPFFDPAADAAFINSLKENLSPGINLVEMATDINDPVFAAKAVAILLEYLKKQPGGANANSASGVSEQTA